MRVETDKIGMMKPDVLDQKIQECIQQVSIMFKVRKTRKNTQWRKAKLQTNKKDQNTAAKSTLNTSTRRTNFRELCDASTCSFCSLHLVDIGKKAHQDKRYCQIKIILFPINSYMSNRWMWKCILKWINITKYTEINIFLIN